MNLEDLFSSPNGLLLLGLVGIILGSLFFGVKQIKVAEHKWAGELAGAGQAIGLSTTVTQPLSDLASGDVPGAIGAGVAAARYLEKRENRLKEGLNVLKTIYASHPAEVKQFFTDFLAGAPDSQLATDFDAATKGLPQVGLGPIASRAHDFVSRIQAIAANPGLADVIGHLPPGQGLLAGLLSAGHTMGAAAAKAAPAVAAVAGTAAGGPVAGAVAGAAASAVANTVTIPDGHSVTITKNTPDASAAA